MKVAVTGGFSYSGRYITRRLLARDAEVITLTGHPHRPNAFAGKVRAFPLDFHHETMTAALRGVDVLVNTYWVRFDRGVNTQSRAVDNTRTLVNAARAAGVRRIVHLSITNPSVTSPLAYFSGKAIIEGLVMGSGLSYAILRPTVLFGDEDVLINNIAFLLRRFPVFALPGDGLYALQPVYVDDVAALAVDAAYREESCVTDAVGPDVFTFRQMVQLIGDKIGARRLLVPAPPRVALFASRVLSALVADVVLTGEEVKGLMAGLLVSKHPPLCTTRLADWLEANKDRVGIRYASELARHYVRPLAGA